MMSDLDQQRELDANLGEVEDALSEEEALLERRRRYAIPLVVVAATAAAILAIPWRDSVQAKGRVAPERWARVFAEAPGVVRDVMRTTGETVDEGDVIAVLDSEEQRDALERARLALTREKQKLADLELRLRENEILREGANVVAEFAGERAVAARRIDRTRLAELEPAADAALASVRRFVTEVRTVFSMDRNARAKAAFEGDAIHASVRSGMVSYSERADAVADHLFRVVGAEAGRQFRFELEELRFTFSLADHSMEEILMKHHLVKEGLLAPMALRTLALELERQTMELAHGFRALAGSARTLLGSRAEQGERVRSAEENRQMLAYEAERLEAERSIVASEIAEAELAVRTAQRHQGKTTIRAPIGGTLAGEALSQYDAVAANAAVGVVENVDRLVLKVLVAPVEMNRIAIGQRVEARTRGGVVSGAVVWTVPVLGQEVRDQEWNVLIELEGDHSGVYVGERVTAMIDVGSRSLVQRWLAPEEAVVTEPRVAFVDDPTELRIPALGRLRDDPASAQLAAERPVFESFGGGG
ncbi:hypothetical protein K2X89_05390 [Myxococcota bacterium]|nr:hypothetical protein [Myxococcota bacterium]